MQGQDKVQDFVRECYGIGGIWYDEGTELQSEVLCLKLKKWSWIGLLVLCVTLLVGCGDHTSRGYLEELAGKELSRVYPTENIEDLVEQFSNGFTVVYDITSKPPATVEWE